MFNIAHIDTFFFGTATPPLKQGVRLSRLPARTGLNAPKPQPPAILSTSAAHVNARPDRPALGNQFTSLTFGNMASKVLV